MKNSYLNIPARLLVILMLITACTSGTEEIISCSGTLQIEVDEIRPSVEGRTDGSITLKASGGSEPYFYSIDGINFQSSNTFVNLAPGGYVATVKDQLECSDDESVFLNEQSIVSFAQQITPILETNCMISTCHCDGNSLCFDNYETVKEKANGIKDRTTKRAMPPAYSGKSLTDFEISLIANWVDQGAENN